MELELKAAFLEGKWQAEMDRLPETIPTTHAHSNGLTVQRPNGQEKRAYSPGIGVGDENLTPVFESLFLSTKEEAPWGPCVLGVHCSIILANTRHRMWFQVCAAKLYCEF